MYYGIFDATGKLLEGGFFTWDDAFYALADWKWANGARIIKTNR